MSPHLVAGRRWRGAGGRGGLPGMACWEARRYAASAAAGQVAALRAARQREAPRAAAPVAAGQAAAVVQRWPDSGRCTMARDATRRRVLAIGAVTLPLAMAGCKGLGALGTPPKAAPGVAVTGDAIMVETRLIAHYGAVLAAVPGLAG